MSFESDMSMDESAPGTPMRCSDAASIDIDDLTQCLQATNLDGKRKGQWNFFPPGTSREEQLRIINGEPPLAAPKKSTEEKEGEVKMTVAEAMDAHLATLAQISASAAVNDTPATPSTARQAPTPPASPDSALELLKTHYREALRTGTSPNALARAPLPKNNQEIELLSAFMADEVHAWSQEMGLGGVVFSPLAHPCYPHWLPSSYLHPSTAVVQKVFEQMTGPGEATEASSDANLSFLDDASPADVANEGEETEEGEDLNRVPGSTLGSMAMDISFGE
jgi:hypothetical protein